MGKKRKAILIIAGGVIGLTILAVAAKVMINNQYRSRIPVMPGSETLSEPVRNQIRDAHEKARKKPTAANLGHLGMVYHSSADYEKAAQCYRLAARKKRSGWIWNYYHGYLNIEMGETDAAIENFTSVIGKEPATGHAWYYRGIACRNRRDYEQAEESLRELIELQEMRNEADEGTSRRDHFPLRTYAMFELSRIYFESGRLDLAEQTLKDLLQESRSYGPAYRLLGNIYSMKGDYELGERYQVRANDLVIFSSPVDTLVDRLCLLSRSELFLLKRIDEAQRGAYDKWTLKLVNNALQYMPENKFLISKAIKVYLWLDLDDQARELMDKHIDLFRDNFIELHNMGSMFYTNELYAESIKYLTAALDHEPDNVEIRKKMAICYWFTGDKQKYQELLDDLLEKNRDDPDILADIACFLFFNLRETEKAASYLPVLKQRAPSSPKVLKLSAGIAEKKGNLSEAIALYQASFKGDPEDIPTIKYLGNLLYGQEFWKESINHYREALVYHPNEPYFLERLGTYLAACPDPSLRDIEEGIEYLERAFIHMASPPGTLISAGRSLAWAYAKKGDKKHAMATIRETIMIGRYEDISPTYLKELEDLYQSFLKIPD